MRKPKKTLEDCLSQEQKEKLIVSSVQIGDVFRIHLGEGEAVVGKNPGDKVRTNILLY